MAEDTALDLITLTASVVEAYVSNNKVSSDDLALMIGTTYEALKTAGDPAPVEPQTPKPDRAAIKKSVQPDYLTSFIDGRKYKSLKRHLAAQPAIGKPMVCRATIPWALRTTPLSAARWPSRWASDARRPRRRLRRAGIRR